MRSDAVGAPLVSRATLAVQLEAALRHDILRGLFEPGERLPTAEIAKRYGVSATPLREAMQRLAGDGLIELDPRAGARVSLISQEDLTDIYAMRDLVEAHAASQSIIAGDELWRASLKEAHDALHAAYAAREQAIGQPALDADLAFADAHIAFHMTLVSACGSRRLLQLVESLSEQAERYRIALRSRTPRWRDAMQEHDGLYRAATEGNGEAIESLLRQHLRATVERLSEHLSDHSSGTE